MDGHLHSPLVNNVAVISPFEVFAKTGQRLPESKFIKLTQYCQWQRWQVWHSSDTCWWLLPPRQNLFNQNSRRCLSVCVKRGQIYNLQHQQLPSVCSQCPRTGQCCAMDGWPKPCGRHDSHQLSCCRTGKSHSFRPPPPKGSAGLYLLSALSLLIRFSPYIAS